MDPTPIKIAIVDDDGGVRDSLQFLLELEGFSVLTFDSAASFLARCKARDIDCLIVDQSMPETTGVTLAAQLRAFGFQGPILLITGLCNEDVCNLAHQAGIQRVLCKPLNDNILPGAIREATIAMNQLSAIS